MKQISIKHITNLHNDWLRGLEFYKEDLRIVQERLEEIAGDNTGKEVSQQVEHFQNQLLIHNGYINELRHRIEANLKTIHMLLQGSGSYVTEYTAAEHLSLNDQYLTEEKLINELRHEFNRFAAKWM